MQIENVHLLLVEDNPRFLSELLEWLREYGYQQIETATSANQAEEKLDEPFDIIISDMRMEQDDSGFAIVNEVKSRNLSSVVIILTANDTVVDCRRAFKSGVWDYISKNMRGNVFDLLHESIQDAINYFNRWGNVQNEQWIS
jgi:DNA-binding NtrC family response regulator